MTKESIYKIVESRLRGVFANHERLKGTPRRMEHLAVDVRQMFTELVSDGLIWDELLPDIERIDVQLWSNGDVRTVLPPPLVAYLRGADDGFKRGRECDERDF